MAEITKPFEVTIDSRLSRLFPCNDDIEPYQNRHPHQTAWLGRLSVYLFRNFPEQDYWKATFPAERQAIAVYGRREQAIWLGAVVLTRSDNRLLDLANREHGSFKSVLGWNPEVLIADAPTDEEAERWIAYETQDTDDEWEHLLDDA